MPKGATKPAADICRGVIPDRRRRCGLEAEDLLERRGCAVRDHPPRPREETEAFMARLGVETTPQAFAAGWRLGGCDDPRVRFGLDPPPEALGVVSPTESPMMAPMGIWMPLRTAPLG